MSNRPPNYLAFLYGKLPSPTGRPIVDGETLGRQCVEQLRALEDREHFPPSLLILLASPAYHEQSKAKQLVAGVHRAFADGDYHDIPLIGGTVAAVFFDQRVYSEGALLVCLASRLVKAEIAIGVDARNNPEMAVNDVLKQLGLTMRGKVDPNPVADRRILTFLPGFGDNGLAAGYPAPRLHRLLREKVRERIWIAGGVTSANDSTRSKSGLQFADRLVLKDAMVTALISSGTPLVFTFGHGLSQTGEYVKVTDISEDGRTIHKFDDRSAAEVIREKGPFVMLGEMSISSEPAIDVPREASDETSVELMREVKNGALFEVLRPDPKKIQEIVEKDLAEARDRIPIANPLACLMFPCNAWRLRYLKVGIEIESLLGRVEEILRGAPCVGGFADGEFGVDKTGRSLFGNGGVAGMIFGDEMRKHSISHQGLRALAENVAAMTGTVEIEEAIRKALKIVVDTGFPGAKLWLVQRNRTEKFVVAKDYIGRRFEKTKGPAIRPLLAYNILAIAARERKPFFIKDSSKDPRCNQEAVRDSGIISQYIVPLLQLDDKALALGVLQIDLGDLRDLGELPRPVKDVLDSFGSIFGATFARIFNLTEAQILRLLDKKSNQSLSAKTLEEGLQTLIKKTLEAFGLKIGYVRLADNELRTLRLTAGEGPCYEDVMTERRQVLFDDISPLSRAFMAGGVTTVNDALDDQAQKQMLMRSRDQYPRIASHLEKIRSFAAVALENEAGEKLGVLGLYSNQPWFFTPPRIRALMSLGKHLSFMIEHFQRKQREEEARRLLQFRSEIWYQPVSGTDLDSLPESLNQITSGFRNAIGAETASLYLLDEATQKLILRAEAGWIDSNWVNRASYQIGDGWTGNVFMSDQVEYISDMRIHKRKTAQELRGRYANQMYGSELPEALTVESIGLPLKIGDQRLGVLTLHRRIPIKKASRGSGFVTTAPAFLQEGASDVAVFVSALLSHHETLWAKEEQRLWEDILGVFAEPENNEILAKKLCRQMVASLDAIQARFYECAEENVDTQIRLIASEVSPPQSESQDLSIPDYFIHLTGSLRKVQIERPGAGNQQVEGGAAITAEAIVERICIPLIVADSLIGLIDLHWNKTTGANPMLIRNNSSNLKTLGNRIASAYLRNRLLSERKEAETEAARRQLAVQTMGAMLVQSGHRVVNLIQYLKHLPALLTEARPDEDLFKTRISNMEERLKTGAMMIERPLRIGQSMVKMALHPCSVSKLVEEAISMAGPQSGQIVVDKRIPPEIVVMAEENQIREAFYNLIHNAIKASPVGGVLTIEAHVIESQKTARILVADTGDGMTREDMEAAMGGFITTRGHTGLGVLISYLLIQANKGAIEIC